MGHISESFVTQRQKPATTNRGLEEGRPWARMGNKKSFPVITESKRSGKLSDAIEALTLSMEHIEEFIHLGEVTAQRNALRNPDYFFFDLNEKAKVLRSRMNDMLNLT